MMRSPYQSPSKAPKRRFLRRRPPENRGHKRLLFLGAAAVAVYLAYTFVLSDTGLVRIIALKHESERLRRQKADLAVRVDELERRRLKQARDPLLEERVARERFHLVRKDEVLYRYKEPPEDSAR